MADGREAEHKSTLEVFVSYAKEDLSLVREIVEELKKPFGYALRFFIDDRSIDDGDDWRDKINDALDRADILLIVSTGHRRESHSFTGYEVGWFSNSKKFAPTRGSSNVRSFRSLSETGCPARSPIFRASWCRRRTCLIWRSNPAIYRLKGNSRRSPP